MASEVSLTASNFLPRNASLRTESVVLMVSISENVGLNVMLSATCLLTILPSCVLQMRVLIFFYALLLCYAQIGADKKINKYVTTLINAKWNETPLVLEAAEYFNDENPSYFWKFVDAFSKKTNNHVIGELIRLKFNNCNNYRVTI